MFEKAEKSGEDPFLLILDGLEDPHNLGAIMRTAECAGAHGVIIPKRGSCGLTETVAKTSAGAIEYMPCIKVTNIVRTIDDLKDMGFWIGACDMGGQDYHKTDLTGKLAIVIGSEGQGISKLVRENCDFVVLETGLGGRYDATNAVPRKLVAAITRIGYDHQELLGDTLAEIAAEKAEVGDDFRVSEMSMPYSGISALLNNIESQIAERNIRKEFGTAYDEYRYVQGLIENQGVQAICPYRFAPVK